MGKDISLFLLYSKVMNCPKGILTIGINVRGFSLGEGTSLSKGIYFILLGRNSQRSRCCLSNVKRKLWWHTPFSMYHIHPLNKIFQEVMKKLALVRRVSYKLLWGAKKSCQQSYMVSSGSECSSCLKIRCPKYQTWIWAKCYFFFSLWRLYFPLSLQILIDGCCLLWRSLRRVIEKQVI